MLSIQGHWHPKDYGPLEMTCEKEINNQTTKLVCDKNYDKVLSESRERPDFNWRIGNVQRCLYFKLKSERIKWNKN